MAKLTLSDKYAVGAVVGLLLALVINNPMVMLAISAAGIVAGFWVIRQSEVRRVGFVAFTGFVVVAAFAVFSLIRAG